ncbi:MAG: response regulator [Anaerolineae bacterium]|nr:response regulator [Anaerolineae bacterium]
MTGTSPEQKIRVLIVDDIPETREQIKKLLMFEADIDVVGTAGTGREAIEIAREAQPNIILMDINMPDMDGIQATEKIATAVPTAAVVMMSVQSEADYLRRAMLAGASDFLTKPVSGDDLYSTLRKVHERKQTMISTLPVASAEGHTGTSKRRMKVTEERLGHIIVVYSSKGGAGCTTIATNLAAGLMRENVKTLLVDAKVQFGDVGVFLNLKSPTTIADLCESVDDMDMELVEHVLVSHDTGLRVLLAPEPDPLMLTQTFRGSDIREVVDKVSKSFDYTIVDTSSAIDDINAELFDIADRIVLVCPPTLAGVRNIRALLRIFDENNFPPEKTLLVLNQVQKDRGRGARITIETELIEKNLKMQAIAEIPQEERVVLHAVNRGVPVIAISKERDRPPIKELIELADAIRHNLMDEEEADEEPNEDNRQQSGFSLFRRH